MKNPSAIVAALAVSVLGVSCSSTMADSDRNFRQKVGTHKRGAKVERVSGPVVVNRSEPVVRRLPVISKSRGAGRPHVVLAGR